jgi:hypothetical protein
MAPQSPIVAVRDDLLHLVLKAGVHDGVARELGHPA